MGFFVYIIHSARLNKYYTGHTEDIRQRLIQHNTGMSDFTSSANDWILVYSEDHSTRADARNREAEIKSKKSRKYIEWLIKSSH